MTIYLNCGNLWTEHYLDKVIELNDAHEHDDIRVASLFGSIAKITPTARSMDRLPYLGWSQRDHYVHKALDNNIQIRYTLNASCLGSLQDFKALWDYKLKNDILDLHNIGIREWTVTSPLLLQEMLEMFPDDFFEVSTIAEVDTPTDASRWLHLGAKGVNISTRINRDFRTIKSIARTGILTSILANEACLYRCPYRRDCYNLSSHDSDRSGRLFGFYPFRHCNNIRMRDLSEWLKAPMILPQWMEVYQKHTGVSWFKIAYRTHPYEIAIPILEYYMDKLHEGNYLSLWPTIRALGDTEEPQERQFISCKVLDDEHFIDRFISKGTPCREILCGEECEYCDNLIGIMRSKDPLAAYDLGLGDKGR